MNDKNFSSVFSLADCALKNQFSIQENWIWVSLVSAGSCMALNHLGWFLQKRIEGDNLCTMFQFVVYSIRNPVVYRTAKKYCFANY